MPAPIKIDILGIDKFTKVLGGITSRAEGFGKRMRGMGKQLAIGLSLPASLFGKAAVDAAAEFEKSFARIGVLTGATSADLEKLRAITTKIGTTTRFSSTEAVQAFEQMTDAGFNFQQSMTALPGVMQMAHLGTMQMADAVDTADTIMEAYGKTAEDTKNVNDILAVAAHRGGLGFGGIAKSLQTLSPVAQQLGISLEDMTATLALAGSSGLNLTRATRGLGTGLTTLLEPSTAAVKAFTKLGIAKSDLFGKDGGLRPISQVFDTLRQKGATTNDMMDIFGRTAGPIMATLLGRGSAALTELRDGMTGTTGTADELSAKMGGTFAEKMAKFNAGLVTMKQTVGNELLPVLIPFGNMILTLMQAFVGLPTPVKRVLAVLGLLAVVVPALLIGVGSLTLGFYAMSAAIMSIPVFGWILAAIAAIIAGVILLVKYWDNVKAAIVAVGRAIKSWIPQGILDFVGLGAGPSAAAPVSSSPAMGLRDRMAAAPSSSETRIIIDNKNDSKIRANNSEGNFNLETYFGATLPVMQ